MTQNHKALSQNKVQELSELCNMWRIKEVLVFGSILDECFNEQSEIDCLIEFFNDAGWDLFEIVKLKRQLSALFEREVDLVEKGSIANPFILKSIEENHQVLYSSHGEKLCSSLGNALG